MLNSKAFFLAVVLVLLSVFAGSCRDVEEGSSGDADSDTDTDVDTDSDSDTDGDSDTEAACPGLIGDGCEEEEPDPLPLLITAEELGVDHLVGMAHNAILAALLPSSEDGNSGVAVFVGDYITAYPDVLWEQAALPLEAEERNPISLTVGSFENGIHGFTALLCEDGNSMCGLWQGVGEPFIDAGSIAAVPGGEVPTDGELRGAAYFAGSFGVCVFGEGIFCFDGDSWTEEIAPGTGPLFNDLGCDRNGDNLCMSFAAVGDGGRFAQRYDADWTDGYVDTEEDLLAISGSGLVAGGTGGVILNGITCTVADSPIVSLYGEWFEVPGETPPDVPVSIPFVGITVDRQLFFGSTTIWDGPAFGPLCPGSLDPDGPEDGAAVGVDYFFCGVAYNLLALTEQALFGTLECGVD